MGSERGISFLKNVVLKPLGPEKQELFLIPFAH